MTQGVACIVADSLRMAAANPEEAAFLRSFAGAAQAASRKREAAEQRGEHIPPFLIAGITDVCSLHCAGCCSRADHACCDGPPTEQWDRILTESDEPGISFILLAGGEPLVRCDVITQAALHRNILFPFLQTVPG